jgi:hypothetical protein
MNDAQSGSVLSAVRPHRASQRSGRRARRTAHHANHQPVREKPADIAETLDYLETVEPLLTQAATLEVVTTMPVAHVADIVLRRVLQPPARN